VSETEATLEGRRESRASALLDRVERAYLKLLRALVLAAATVLIFYAAWLAISSAIKLSRSPESVVEQPAAVTADELGVAAAAPSKAKVAGTEDGEENPEQRRFYDGFVKRYHGLFRSKFEKYRQPEDKQLTVAEFGDAFVRPIERMELITEGKLDFPTDQADLEALLKAMTAAADKPVTLAPLQQYRAAVKVNTCSDVQRSRTTYRRGWNEFSTSCRGWYQEPIGCPVERPVVVDYVEKVCSMQFPKGTRSHTEIFRAYQEKFFELLYSRREENKATAQAEREAIVLGKAEGQASLGYAVYVVGSFVVLMFFFLLIAIERHQRRLARES